MGFQCSSKSCNRSDLEYSQKLIWNTAKNCGRGLAPDGGGSVNSWVADTLLSGASPLPHGFFSVCRISVDIAAIAALLDQALHRLTAQHLMQHLIHPRGHPLQTAAHVDRRTVRQPSTQHVRRFAQAILYVDLFLLVAGKRQVQQR